MIRCIRLWTGDDDNSYFEEGVIDLSKGERGDILSGTAGVVSISFRETRAGGAFEWHDAPARQFKGATGSRLAERDANDAGGASRSAIREPVAPSNGTTRQPA